MMTTLQYAHSDAAVYWILHRNTQQTLITYKANCLCTDKKNFDYGEGHKEFHCNDCLHTVLYAFVEISLSVGMKESQQIPASDVKKKKQVQEILQI
jgi:hypothetical protein